MKRLKSILKRQSSSKQIEARKTRDAQFLDILRGKCVRAAGIGALTAAAGAIPGLGRVLGLVFGELLDANMLTIVQRQLVEETFDLYEFNMPDALHASIVAKDNVFRFYIQMQHVGMMHCYQCFAYLLGVFNSFLFGNCFTLIQNLHQCFPLEEFQHQIRRVIILKNR